MVDVEQEAVEGMDGEVWAGGTVSARPNTARQPNSQLQASIIGYIGASVSRLCSNKLRYCRSVLASGSKLLARCEASIQAHAKWWG